ncbi:cold-shock protein [Nanoarchaeota archaeon]
MKGKVKFFNEMKGFGFIEGEDGKEYFVHQTGLKDGVTIRENDSVSFDVEQGDRGPKAANVAKEAADAPAEEAPAESEEQPEEGQ